jgi:glutamyl-tRNA synthetase
MTAKQPARVRFAPSPTGAFHIGSARTALYDFLLARQTGGRFILRIEDTDLKRLVPGSEAEILDSLTWLGLKWDEGPFHQSERRKVYQAHADELIERGHAYHCFCTSQRLAELRKLQQQRREPPHYDGLCRGLDPQEVHQRRQAGEPAVVRFKSPRDGQTTAVDLLRGPITVDNHTIGDQVLLKSDGLPVYHLAAMVDDHLMGITHVLRASEWLPTFPLHVNIYRAFDWPEPVWVHLSVFLNPSGKGKLSKRHAVSGTRGASAVFIPDLRRMGYLPEAVLNWLALMGWSYDAHSERFDLQDLVAKFSLERLNPSPAAVNFSKLDHFNGLYIRSLAVDDLAGRLAPFFADRGYAQDPPLLGRITPLIQERITTLAEGPEIAGFFFEAQVNPPAEDLVGKDMTPSQSAHAARQAHATIVGLERLDPETLEPALRGDAEKLGLSAGQYFGILRLALTGQRISPPLIESMAIIGREAILERLQAAAAKLASLEA